MLCKALGTPRLPAVKPPFLFNHPLSALWVEGLSRWAGMLKVRGVNATFILLWSVGRLWWGRVSGRDTLWGAYRNTILGQEQDSYGFHKGQSLWKWLEIWLSGILFCVYFVSILCVNFQHWYSRVVEKSLSLNSGWNVLVYQTPSTKWEINMTDIWMALLLEHHP